MRECGLVCLEGLLVGLLGGRMRVHGYGDEVVVL